MNQMRLIISQENSTVQSGTKYLWYARVLAPSVYVITVFLLILGGFLSQILFSTSMGQWWYYAIAGVVLPLAIITVIAVICTIFMLVLILLFVLILVLILLTDHIFKPITNWIMPDAWKQKRVEARERKEREQRVAEEKMLKERIAMYEELEKFLACNGEPQPKVSALPPLRLQLLHIKAQDCEPYAQ